MPTEKKLSRGLAVVLSSAVLLAAGAAAAEVCNLKIITDASPDYSDLASLLHSATAKWASPEEKCWALFYWNHIARRQTAPMILHGVELTDLIRSTPFDLRLALPDEAGPAVSLAPADDGSERPGSR